MFEDQVFLAEALTLYAQYRVLSLHNEAIVRKSMAGDYSHVKDFRCTDEEHARRAMLDYLYEHGATFDVACRRGRKVRLMRPLHYTRGVYYGKQEIVLETVN